MTNPEKPPTNTREVMRLEKDGTVHLLPDVTEAELRQIIAMLAQAYHELRMKHAPAPDKAIDG